MNCRLCGTLTKKIVHRFKEPYKMYKCRDCSILFLDPVPDEKTIRSFYTEEYFRDHNLQYFKNIDKNTIESRIRLVQEGVIHEVHPFKTEGRMMEIGCASGFFLKAAERMGWEVMGVEVSKYASNFASQTLGLNVINSRLEEANLPHDYFDVVIMFMVLEHMIDPLKIIKTVKSYLKKNGILIIKVPNYRCIESLLFGQRWHQLSFPYHLYIFSPLSIIKIAEKLNLRLLKLSTYRHLSNFINPTSNHICGRLAKEGEILKEKTGKLKNIIRFFYKSTVSIIDERFLLGEQLRIVLQKKK